MEGIGGRVVAERDRLGMTQKDLADATGLPQATISRIERNDIKQPRVEVLRKLAEALHVTADYLINRTQEMSATDTIGADNRAAAIFRDYRDLSEEGKQELSRFVRWLREEQNKKHRGSRG